jgi:DNA (cytosine-5)-methyltransferase 1
MLTNEFNRASERDEPISSSKSPSNDRPMTMVDLFAGCGGLSLGMENAGFTPVFVNELSPDALDTYLANRHYSLGNEQFSENQNLHCNDAQDLKGKRLEAMVSDLESLDVDLKFDADKASKKSGGGSNLDLLAGGPPCQGYSGIGIRRSYAVDKRELPSNQLYARMAQIIRRLRPRTFLFENVRGLLNSKWTRGDNDDYIWPDVLAEFRSIPGYEVRWKLVFAKDYGVPQNRPRVLLVGIRKDIIAGNDMLDPTRDEEDAVECGFLPKGQSGDFPHLIDLLGDLVDPEIGALLHAGKFPPGKLETKKYPRRPMSDIQRHLRAAPPWAPDRRPTLTEQEYSKHRPEILRKFAYMLANGGEIPEGAKTKKFSQRLLRERWGNTEPNMTATSLPDDYVHFSQPRILTVREWARLQLFPDWYEFKGKRTTGGIRRAGNPQKGIFDRETPKYTQIGNAVPVGLSEAVGRHFKKILKGA